MHELAALQRVAERLAGAHQLRSVLEAVGSALADSHGVQRVRLLGLDLATVGEDGVMDWQEVGAAAAGVVVRKLRLGSQGSRPRLVMEIHGMGAQLRGFSPEFWAALAAIVDAAVSACLRLARVARLSQRAHRSNRELRRQLDPRRPGPKIVAASPLMRSALEQARLVAAHKSTVLLRGESGTGKELFAQYIHQASLRAGGPWVAVNCSALPDSLLESTLFGHLRGAFTGALQDRRGCFEAANGGTLFLDEIGELSPPAQAKLLRVLQEGVITRVGDHSPRPVDVRLVAATHRDLEAMVAQGQFRGDLLYRINVFPIRLAPLRQRSEDLPQLIRSIVDELAQQLGMDAPGIDDELLDELRRRSWPGNVRELHNLLHRAMILGRGPYLRLPASERYRSSTPAQHSAREAMAQPIKFDAAARTAIEVALQHSGGRIYGQSGAAELLGLKPSTLQAKIKKLGVRR